MNDDRHGERDRKDSANPSDERHEEGGYGSPVESGHGDPSAVDEDSREDTDEPARGQDRRGPE